MVACDSARRPYKSTGKCSEELNFDGCGAAVLNSAAVGILSRTAPWNGNVKQQNMPNISAGLHLDWGPETTTVPVFSARKV